MALNEHKGGTGRADRDPALDRLYQAGEREEPPAGLDAAIRAAARREVGAGPRPLSRLRAWRVPVSIAAVLVLSASLVMLMREEGGEALVHPGQPGVAPPAGTSANMSEFALEVPKVATLPEKSAPERDARASRQQARQDEASRAEDGSRRDSALESRATIAGPPSETAARASPPPAPSPADLAKTVPMERQQASEDRMRAPAVSAAPQGAATAAEAAGGAAAEPARPTPASPPVKTAASPAQPLMKPPLSESEPPRDIAAESPRPAPVAPPAKAAAPAPQAKMAPPPAMKPAPRREERYGELGAARGIEAPPATAAQEGPRVLDDSSARKREGAPSLTPRAAALVKELDAQPPEKWLVRIEELRRAGRLAEAEELTAEFKRRFPAAR